MITFHCVRCGSLVTVEFPVSACPSCQEKKTPTQYHGRREKGKPVVIVDDLETARNLIASGPDRNAEFDWGYAGKGPRALAYSLLEDACGTPAAMDYAEAYAILVVAGFGMEWTKNRHEIQAWVRGREGITLARTQGSKVAMMGSRG